MAILSKFLNEEILDVTEMDIRILRLSAKLKFKSFEDAEARTIVLLWYSILGFEGLMPQVHQKYMRKP